MIIIIRSAMAASVTALNSAISTSVRAARLAALPLRCLLYASSNGVGLQARPSRSACVYAGVWSTQELLAAHPRRPPACHKADLPVVSDARRAFRNLTSTGSGSWSLTTVVQHFITRMANTTLVPAIYERGAAAETMRTCFQVPTSS
jgi:hypothetical protein